MIKLSPRLQMIADMVRKNLNVLDVGTDHAFLPAYLVLNGIVKSAVASDLREMPLKNAMNTLAEYNLTDKIRLCLSDGLDAFSPDCADDIVVAGMGGELIVDIISRTPWLKDKGKHLIIQPMSHVEDVRKYLCCNGFEILYEDAAFDSGYTYVALSAIYTGQENDYSNSYYYIGELRNCKKPEALDYLTKISERLKIKAYSLLKASKDSGKVNELFSIISDIERCVSGDDCQEDLSFYKFNRPL